ncbi:MAG: RluA family pseudouridine synthase [Clostridiales bacterium]|nr:RluA family pseudouridine synthase [Clostridiales bacterium]
MEKVRIISDTDGKRLDKYISDKLDKYSRNFVSKLIDDGLVTVDGIIRKSNYKIKLNDSVEVCIPEPEHLDVLPEDIPLDVVYEDDDIIVVNKPKGMVVHPAAGNREGTLVNALLKHCEGKLSDINGVIRPGIVHRIDKDTTGLLVVAKNNVAHEFLSELFSRHDIIRKYVAVVEGVINREAGKIDAPIGRHPNDRKKMTINAKNGRRAVTHFKVLERFKNATLIEITLETGRTHQIRVHMSSIGYPVMGDSVYGRKNKYNLIGQTLHAKTLGFLHPSTKEYIEFDSELPEYFKKLLEKLREE